jgi:malate dehydrogenase (oxaloacetate-decarboxylating)
MQLDSLIGGIDPANTLSVILDVGTNNEELLNDDLYVVMLDNFLFHSMITHSNTSRVGIQSVSKRKTTTYSWTSEPFVLQSCFVSRLSRFIQLVRKYLPHTVLHFEDFGVSNAHHLLTLYRDQHPVFNDDM